MRCVKLDNWSQMAPPYDDYEFFMNHDEFPFEDFESGFSHINAWWCAEASVLSYSDKDKVQAEFKKTGFDQFEHIETKTVDCFVVSDGAIVFVIFRGSELRPQPGEGGFKKVIADWSTNLNFKLVEWETGGRVHSGFKNALDEIWPKLLHVLKPYKNHYIWFTGHSLGAALATLAAKRIGCASGCYCFGSPRVGDLQFRDDFNVKNFCRITHNTDVVHYLPFFEDYHHVGHEQRITKASIDHHDTDQEKLDIKGIKAALSFNDNPVPQCIYDHVPLHYSIFFWNSINNQLGYRGV